MIVVMLLLFIVFFVIFIIISNKINNARYRAKQTILGKAGIGNSNIISATDSAMEKGKLKKFLENHPTYTEDSIKQLIKDFAVEITHQNLTHSAEQKIIDKLSNDSKITKYSNMQIVGCSINGYNENARLFMAKVTFSDNRDEYMMFLRFQLSGDELILTKYQMQKGVAVGF